jgi:catechol 2,3-dioxygenase-like lactoylglutathione lyase family enzyme
MSPDQAATELAIDHVALPLRHTGAMIAFYRALGLAVDENPFLVQVHLGDQMINFHQPDLWQGDFSLRAPAAVPPCGDLCLVWSGPADTLAAALDRAGADIVEGPVERVGGRGVVASSVYVRDPDGNLLEFMVYPEVSKGKMDGSRPGIG